METFTDNADQSADSASSIDRTVSYFLIALGIVLGFLLILSTFVQVNRVTTKPSRVNPSPVRVGTPEIGGATESQAG